MRTRNSAGCVLLSKQLQADEAAHRTEQATERGSNGEAWPTPREHTGTSKDVLNTALLQNCVCRSLHFKLFFPIPEAEITLSPPKYRSGLPQGNLIFVEWKFFFKLLSN